MNTLDWPELESFEMFENLHNRCTNNTWAPRWMPVSSFAEFHWQWIDRPDRSQVDKDCWSPIDRRWTTREWRFVLERKNGYSTVDRQIFLPDKWWSMYWWRIENLPSLFLRMFLHCKYEMSLDREKNTFPTKKSWTSHRCAHRLIVI